jgi:hypothetical protein
MLKSFWPSSNARHHHDDPSVPGQELQDEGPPSTPGARDDSKDEDQNPIINPNGDVLVDDAGRRNHMTPLSHCST